MDGNEVPQGQDEINNQSTNEELAEFVADQLRSGVFKDNVTSKLIKKGIDNYTAEQLVNQIDEIRRSAYKKAGTKDLIYGFIALAIGIGITLATWMAASSGGSYWVMWGAMALGIFYLVRGLYRKIYNSINSTERLQWILGSLVIVCLIIGGGVYLTNRIANPPELVAPEDSFFVNKDTSYWENEILSTFRAAGTVVNTDSEWTISNIKLKMDGLDKSGKVIATYDVSVTPSTLKPGKQGIYSSSLKFPDACISVHSNITWEWIPPK